MNWLFFVFLALVVLSAVGGYRKGLIRTVVSMVSLVLVLIIASLLTPVLGTVICENTQIDEKLEVKCKELLEEKSKEEKEDSEGGKLSILPFPDSVKEKLDELEQKNENLPANLASLIVSIMTFLVSAVLALLLIKLILRLTDMIAAFPLIGQANRLGGLLLGVARGILWIWFIFMVVSLLGGAEWAGFLMKGIQGDKVLSYLYNNNWLWLGITYAFTGA